MATDRAQYLVDLLKEETARVSLGGKWLVWNTESKEWNVYDHQPYARKSTLVFAGDSLSAAIDVLKAEASQ